jgi:hypothetical protein
MRPEHRGLHTVTGARGVAAGLALVLALVAAPAHAHLMTAGKGTVNVVGNAVFAVLSVPVSALHEAPIDRDGLLEAASLTRNEERIRAEIDRRFVLLDGIAPARTVRVDLILAPEHGAAGDRAANVIVLKHAELDAPPMDLRVRCDLFGPGVSDGAIAITATRHPESGTETDVGELTPEASERAFFRPVGSPAQASTAGSDRTSRGLLVLGALLVAAGLTRSSRTRSR